jgi:hypothetical protein
MGAGLFKEDKKKGPKNTRRSSCGRGCLSLWGASQAPGMCRACHARTSPPTCKNRTHVRAVRTFQHSPAVSQGHII